MSAIIGLPFYNHYYSQEMEVATKYVPSRKLIVTVVKSRETGKIFWEYVSLDWAQAERWHKKAIEKLVNLNTQFRLDGTWSYGN